MAKFNVNVTDSLHASNEPDMLQRAMNVAATQCNAEADTQVVIHTSGRRALSGFISWTVIVHVDGAVANHIEVTQRYNGAPITGLAINC